MLLSILTGQMRLLGDDKIAEPQVELPQDKIVTFYQRNQVRMFSLFGSVLREDFGPESDIDVLVEFEENARIGFMALGRMQRELAELLGRRVDLVPRGGLKPLIRDNVLDSAQVLYAA